MTQNNATDNDNYAVSFQKRCDDTVKDIAGTWEEALQSDRISEFFEEEVLTVEAVCSLGPHEPDYVSAKVYVGLGGPTVWLDTGTCRVELTWGGFRASYGMSEELTGQIDDMVAGMWETTRGHTV